MGDARIFAVWGQRGDRAKGIGGKTGHVIGHLAIHGGMWGSAALTEIYYRNLPAVLETNLSL